MIKSKDIFFIASAWNIGTGFIIKDYNFIITTIQVVGFSKKVIIKHSELGKHLAKVIFIDYFNGLVFIEIPRQINSSLSIFNFELAVVEQPVKIYRTNYNNDLISHSTEIINNDFMYNNFNHLLINSKKHFQTSGAVIFNNRNEFVGITKYIENEKLFIGLPAKYILKSMEEFVVFKDDAIRCPKCLNIIRKKSIIDDFCPKCTATINEELMKDYKPKLSKVEQNIEKTLIKLGYEIDFSRLGRYTWEINEGTATIFIRYEPKQKFIVAFSKLINLNGLNTNKILKYLLSENSKINDLSFSKNDNNIYLSAPYIFDEDFNEEYAEKIFYELFKKADYYDDIIENIQKEEL